MTGCWELQNKNKNLAPSEQWDNVKELRNINVLEKLTYSYPNQFLTSACIVALLFIQECIIILLNIQSHIACLSLLSFSKSGHRKNVRKLGTVGEGKLLPCYLFTSSKHTTEMASRAIIDKFHFYCSFCSRFLWYAILLPVEVMLDFHSTIRFGFNLGYWNYLTKCV